MMISLSKKNILFLFLCLTFVAPLSLANSKKRDSSPLSKKIITIEKIAKLSIAGSINPATANYLKTGFKKAEKERIDLIIIQLNTPGGLVTTTKDILNLFGESDIPIVVWIGPSGASATSAGAIIASGAHLLFMGPGTNIGAATPVQMSGNIDDKNDLRKKSINDLVALVQSLSELHHRNPVPFAQMIAEAKSFKANEALKLKLINGLAATTSELQEALNGRIVFLKGQEIGLKTSPGLTWVEYPMDFGQKVLDIFSNPSMAYILFLIGAALIYLELQAPGGLIAGSLGTISILLAGIGFQVLPLNVGAFALIMLSFVLFIMELYITSYGILSLSGLASLIAGSLFLFRTDDAYLHFSSTLIFSTVSAIALFMGVISYFLIKDLREKKKNLFNQNTGRRAIIIKAFPKIEGEPYYYQLKVGGEFWKGESQQSFQEGDHVTIKKEIKDQLLLII